MFEKFTTHIEEQYPFLLHAKNLLACSGGLDSVVLVHLCKKLGLDFGIAHCNFNLRGEESNEDQRFVERLGDELGKKVYATSFDTKKEIKTTTGSLQMVARELRYRWFDTLQKEKGYDYVLTAHHADDNLETFLINLSRGTGIEGLLGIPQQNESVVRPLLPFSREAILKYARFNEISWRDDSSNEETKYLRNKIRHELVPKMKELQPSFLENFKTSQKHLSQTNEIIQGYGQNLKKQLFESKDGLVKIKLGNLLALDPLDANLYLLFKTYGFTEWNDVKNLLTATSGKQVISKTHRLVKDREYLLLSAIEGDEVTNFHIHEGQLTVETPIQLSLQEVDTFEKGSKNILFIDKDKLKYPLKLRKWNNGDYFYPLGMMGKKKLSKFFKDEKMDIISKKRQWLLCSSDEIVWVIGRRSDERYKIDRNTKHILKITYTA